MKEKGFLLDLARAISDGTDVDWEETAKTAGSDEDVELLPALKDGEERWTPLKPRLSTFLLTVLTKRPMKISVLPLQASKNVGKISWVYSTFRKGSGVGIYGALAFFRATVFRH